MGRRISCFRTFSGGPFGTFLINACDVDWTFDTISSASIHLRKVDSAGSHFFHGNGAGGPLGPTDFNPAVASPGRLTTAPVIINLPTRRMRDAWRFNVEMPMSWNTNVKEHENFNILEYRSETMFTSMQVNDTIIAMLLYFGN